MQNISPGTLVLQEWLTKNGISPQLTQKYVSGDWLRKLRSGFNASPGKNPQWFNAVEYLIEQLAFPVHLAGLTSLAYQAKSHYLQLRETAIWLEVPPKKTLPKWFKAFSDFPQQISSTQSQNSSSDNS